MFILRCFKVDIQNAERLIFKENQHRKVDVTSVHLWTLPLVSTLMFILSPFWRRRSFLKLIFFRVGLLLTAPISLKSRGRGYIAWIGCWGSPDGF